MNEDNPKGHDDSEVEPESESRLVYLRFRRVFGDECRPVTAFKWALGHLIAAAGQLGAEAPAHADVAVVVDDLAEDVPEHEAG